jgi:hypothetical protein
VLPPAPSFTVDVLKGGAALAPPVIVAEELASGAAVLAAPALDPGGFDSSTTVSPQPTVTREQQSRVAALEMDLFMIEFTP